MESKPLNEETAIEYVRSAPTVAELFTDLSSLKCVPITEGNVNLLFKVYEEGAEGATAVLVKQAMPYAWRYPEFKLPLDRSRIEKNMLTVEAKYCPDLVPEIYLYDEERHIIVMEFFEGYLDLRVGLMKGNRYPNLAKHVGEFIARTVFYTSDLYLSSDVKKEMVPQYINPVLCKIQEDLVFTEPFVTHSNNHWTELLAPIVSEIYEDDSFRSEVLILKEAYMSNAQALIHNDLHTGSMLVNNEETKIIDPEFAFYGPIGHDIGTFLGNLALGYAAQEFHSEGDADRNSYRQWIAETIQETWNVFEKEFLKLWDEKGIDGWASETFKKKYLRQILQDSAGFGGAEMTRRLIGMAHVQDFEEITDEKVKARAESLGLNIAKAWVMNRHSFNSIDQLIDIVIAEKPHYYLV